ncbi:unnamed protein product [Pleuronectes platessa]|uniref:Uncharacterized protein n=1 Tax=Pleuronectes platessa TaxID=8262 RepID=A0A9N7ZEN1_PLEPL|nr:unnamed protein product [Pleuronectes platessa]
MVRLRRRMSMGLALRRTLRQKVQNARMLAGTPIRKLKFDKLLNTTSVLHTLQTSSPSNITKPPSEKSFNEQELSIKRENKQEDEILPLIQLPIWLQEVPLENDQQSMKKEKKKQEKKEKREKKKQEKKEKQEKKKMEKKEMKKIEKERKR